MSNGLTVRIATVADAHAIAAIYNEGIEDRTATFETRLRSVDEVERWFDGEHPVVVVQDHSGVVVGFAATSPYRSRECYRGVTEFSVYVLRASRGRGIGRLALQQLIDEASGAGYWKMLSRVFPENTDSRVLLRKLGFREIGIYEKHGKLNGIWRDVVIVERLLQDNIV